MAAFQGQVLLFTITGCPFCSRSRKVLADLQVPFVEVNLDHYPDRRYEMQEKTGRRTVPQIFFNSKHIGGFDDLKKLYDSGSLEDELKGYKNSFVARDLVTWLVEQKKLPSREEAVKQGLELQAKHFIHHVTFDHEFKDEWLFFRLLGDGHLKALNAKLSYACIPRPGFWVDYRGISKSHKFEAYVRATAELKRVDLLSLSVSEKIAFFVNVYNALVVHGFVVLGPPTNHLKRYRFFSSTSYIVSGRCYSLNDLENGVLRSNRKPPANFRRPFSSSDPRLKVALEEVDPRVHFALMLCWVCGHMAPGDKRSSLKDLLDLGNYRLKFQKYNWEVNTH
ncbi:Glutaredoxin-C3 [Geodia barretti]|uniref:Glutaredoxin-C3 n=1 Tax=Geodia barretti TaxID=519541 RepID=A0AA35RAE4_GEOBA|nr:Glutaredoxin-C3 [Geodia barretti]